MNIADDLVRAYDDGYAQGKADAVIHGHWIKTDNGWKCSACKESTVFYALVDGRHCPKCGAKMDGADDG